MPPLQFTSAARPGVRTAAAAMLVVLAASPSIAAGQQAGATPAGRGGAPAGPPVVMDTARARLLYVSNRPEDLPRADFARQVAAKHATDSIYAARFAGRIDFQKITYRSAVDGMTIPAYLFSPLAKRGPRGHAAMVWVHEGIHGNWDQSMLPFVREAVERGYVVIAPDYRGSTGHGEAHFMAIDYGGREVDDVVSAVDYLRTLSYVDTARLGIMGWSHGGFITSHVLFRDEHPFKAAGAAIVPVTNLVFRLSLKGPRYQRDYAAEATIGGLPFEKQDEYIKRSPVFRVDHLKVPMLVHVATNDTDVNFVEDQQMVDALRARKPDLAETKVYVDPPPVPRGGGRHTFSRRVDMKTLERDDSPEQRDSWNRTWAFFDWWLRPYEDRSKKM